MYPVSATFKDYIKRDTVSYEWYGTIVDSNSTEYDIDPETISQNSGKITKRSGTDKLAIGTSCASELSMDLYLDVDRYLLFGATVNLNFRLYEGVDANQQPVSEDVPMGIYTISECNQSNGKLRILAYDNMVKFDDVKFSATLNINIQTPYAWLVQMCTACGVVLGNTQAQINAMPNGIRPTGFADCVTDAKTWRDVLNYLSAYLGGFAYIGRDGKLYIGHYGSAYVDTISASLRFSSELSDFRTTYDGLYAVHKASGVQEYISNQNTGGLVLDLGTNPFLQISDDTNRHGALQEIIDEWNGVYYVPYESTLPIMPHYDIGDVLKFVDNQADVYDYGALTEIVFAIGSKMSITCSGDNPRLAEAQDRFTKTLEGLSSEYSNGQEIGGKEYWHLFNHSTSDMTIGSTETLVTEIEYEQKTFGQTLEMILVCEAELSATAVVNIRVVVDDEIELQTEVTESKSMKGKRIFHCTNPQKIYGQGTHACKVYMTVTDSPLLWSDLV